MEDGWGDGLAAMLAAGWADGDGLTARLIEGEELDFDYIIKPFAIFSNNIFSIIRLPSNK